MAHDRTMTQSLMRVLIAAAVVLAFGLTVNLLTTGEGWSVLDIILVEVLVAGAVFVYELASQHVGARGAALLAVGVAAVGGAAAIVGEVDDAPGMILIGMGLVATAVGIGLRAARPRAGEAVQQLKQ